MLNIEILCVGGLKEDYFRSACAEYEKRLSGYVKLHTTECKGDEGLMPFLQSRPRAYKIALCVEGKMLDSPALAHLIEEKTNAGTAEFVFVIGGSDGLPEQVKSACHYRLSFSPMTFPHRLMRVILCEQLYRAQTILHNTTYHK